MTAYNYVGTTYNTLAEVEVAVTAFKNTLDNQPTTYCEVKEVTGNNEDGWVFVTDKLTDSEILSLDAAKTYYVYSPYDGEAFHGLTSSEVNAKIDVYRNIFATAVRANTVYTMSAPTNEDMSIYINT